MFQLQQQFSSLNLGLRWVIIMLYPTDSTVIINLYPNLVSKH